MEQTTNTNAAGYTKPQILALKNAIKVKVAEQKSLKPQRKPVHFKGERTVSAYEATWKSQLNKWELRHMYYAYAIVRGKDPLTGVTPKKEQTVINQIKVEGILKTYQTSA
jgi:hypothetical protein